MVAEPAVYVACFGADCGVPRTAQDMVAEDYLARRLTLYGNMPPSGIARIVTADGMGACEPAGLGMVRNRGVSGVQLQRGDLWFGSDVS